MTRGAREPQEECYSAQDTDPASTRNWVHKMTSSKPEEERLDWWNVPVKGEREIFDDQAMALWLYDLKDDESKENGEKDEANQAMVTVKNVVEDLEPPRPWINPKEKREGKEFPGSTQGSIHRLQQKTTRRDNAKSIPVMWRTTLSLSSQFSTTANSCQRQWTLMRSYQKVSAPTNQPKWQKRGAYLISKPMAPPCMCQWAPAQLPPSRPPQSLDFLKN